MKASLIRTAVLLFIISSLFSSCSFLQKEEFAQRKYYDFPRTKHSLERKQDIITSSKQTTKSFSVNPLSEPVAELTSTVNDEITSDIPVTNLTSTPQNVFQQKEIIHSSSHLISEFEKTSLRNNFSEKSNNPSSSDGMLIIMILAAIIVPPIGVFIKNNWKTNSWFWITFVLCVLAGFGWGIGIALAGGGLWLVAAIIALMNVFDII